MVARGSVPLGRLLLLAVIALGLAPGTWVRTTAGGPSDDRQILVIDRLVVPELNLGEGVEVAGAWHLTSPNDHFSGYSALLAMGDGTLLALSDYGRQLRFAPPGAPLRPVGIGVFARLEDDDERQFDLEAATHEPSGYLWAAYEFTNRIERYDSDFTPAGSIRPMEMRGWPSNRGPEAMVRLADGRFIVLAEGSSSWFAEEMPGLLFPGDPVRASGPESFRFRGPEAFVPVDMAQSPDGRVLILLRAVRWNLPPHFEGKLVVADPDEIMPGQLWPWREIAHLAEPLPMDNYEGLAVEPAGDGRVALWLISDDNRSWFQRTLLLKLLWQPNEKARGSSHAPR